MYHCHCEQEPERLLLYPAVKEVDEAVVGAAEDLAAVVAEAHGEDAEAAVVRAQRQCLVPLLVAENVHLVDCRQTRRRAQDETESGPSRC